MEQLSPNKTRRWRFWQVQWKPGGLKEMTQFRLTRWFPQHSRLLAALNGVAEEELMAQVREVQYE
jgi:hypothetical protein